jgi:hypothetical protein
MTTKASLAMAVPSSSSDVDVDTMTSASGASRKTLILAIGLGVAGLLALVFFVMYLSASSTAASNKTQLEATQTSLDSTKASLAASQATVASTQTSAAAAQATATAVQASLSELQASAASTQQRLAAFQTQDAIDSAALNVVGTYTTQLDAVALPSLQRGELWRATITHEPRSQILRLSMSASSHPLPSMTLGFASGAERTWTMTIGNASAVLTINSAMQQMSLTPTGSSTALAFFRIPAVNQGTLHPTYAQGVYRTLLAARSTQLAVSYDLVANKITVTQGISNGLINDGTLMLVNAIPWTFTADVNGLYKLPYSTTIDGTQAGSLLWDPSASTMTLTPVSNTGILVYHLVLDANLA